MPALFVFLLKVNVALLLFCAGYYLALRHLTFYTLNRIYLVTAILFASIYPQVNFSEFAQHHQQLAKPVQAVAINWQTPAASLIGPINQPVYWQWITIAFWAGAILLLLRLLLQLFSLVKLHRGSTAKKIHNHNVRIVDGNAGPFSFWKSIYVNPANHQPDDLKAILLHEQVHVNEWHTLDILLAELSTIFYWFNPGIWLIKRAIRENIEFITDRKILNKGVDSKQYQYSLVNVSFAAGSNTLVNHFNISTIKKRIIMMNAKKSSKFNLTRYAFLVPAVTVLLFVFTVSNAALIKKNAHTVKLMVNNIKIPVFVPVEKRLQPEKPLAIAVNNNQADLTAVNVKTVNGKLLDTTKKDLIITGSNNLSVSTASGLDTNRITKVRINGVDFKSGSLRLVNGKIEGFDTIKIDTTVRGKLNRKLTFKIDTAISGKLKGKLAFAEVTVDGYKTPARLSFGTGFVSNTFSLSHLSDKLIIIDGKIASEADLKKLSAFDIDRMVLKTDEETKELYGDKAKNGIVFILTKKVK